jgi:ring-1,2-phenylacetyl-CoA epoxidase subunit PaaC
VTSLGPAERAVLLAFADDEHLMGQRHTEWIGVAPFLEEDMAFASIGQDELGHATALVRHWMYDTAEALRWQELAGSSDVRLRDIAVRAMSEERYHLRHADALLDALAGDAHAGARLADALAEMLPLGVALFEDPLGAHSAVGSVVGRPLATLTPEWRAAVDRRFGSRTWDSIEAVDQAGRTVRSAQFATVYADMREVIMLDPDATW